MLFFIFQGGGKLSGGQQHNPPTAVGIGEWDVMGGLVGEGGNGNPNDVNQGCNGAVRSKSII